MNVRYPSGVLGISWVIWDEWHIGHDFRGPNPMFFSYRAVLFAGT
jgi:hypothetical protein